LQADEKQKMSISKPLHHNPEPNADNSQKANHTHTDTGKGRNK